VALFICCATLLRHRSARCRPRRAFDKRWRATLGGGERTAEDISGRRAKSWAVWREQRLRASESNVWLAHGDKNNG